MSKFSESAGYDSFDDILANIDEANAVSQITNVPSDVKKTRFSMESDDGMSDSLLANMTMPTTSTSTESNSIVLPTAEKAVPVPMSNGKTNCVLVNPKQRGISQVHTIESKY